MRIKTNIKSGRQLVVTIIVAVVFLVIAGSVIRRVSTVKEEVTENNNQTEDQVNQTTSDEGLKTSGESDSELPSSAADQGSDQPAERETVLQRYLLNYDPAVFEANSDKERWLFFYADWCYKCRGLDENIRANLNNIPDDVLIFRVNYDTETTLKQEYKVQSQTTVLVLNASGQEQKRFVGQSSQHTLAELIEEFN